MKSFEIENIKKCNIELYEQLFKHYYKHLIFFSYRYVKDKQIAEDVVHDVFVNIWNKKDKLDFTLNFKTYLYTAVRNQSLKQIKKTIEYVQVEVDVIQSKHYSTPETIMEQNEFEKTISKAISELPEKRREIFYMHRFDNLTYSEIALTLNLSIKTVETQMSRSLKFLREKLSTILENNIK